MKRNETIILLASAATTFGVLGLTSGQWAAVGLGSGLGLAGGLYGLARIHEALGRVPSLGAIASQNAVLAALVSTLFGRMIVLGAGLALGLGVLDLSPIWIVIAFFSLYVIAQGLEIRLALATRDIQPAA